MNTIIINVAQDGGYTVEGYSDYGDRRPLLFAGTLNACLEYIRDKLYNAELARLREDVA